MNRSHHKLKHGNQRGAVLIVALIALIAMTLAGLAVMRTVDTGVLLAGNIAFRKNAVNSAGSGIQSAEVWLVNKSAADLEASSAANGYYASWDTTFNPKTFDWSSDSTSKAVSSSADETGNTIRYVIHRLCDAVGAASSVHCVRPKSSSPGTPNDAFDYSTGGGLTGSSQVYFRITARVTGPKGSVSFVQATLY
jgi:type IV pilus assembly protein PilX